MIPEAASLHNIKNSTQLQAAVYALSWFYIINNVGKHRSIFLMKKV